MSQFVQLIDQSISYRFCFSIHINTITKLERECYKTYKAKTYKAKRGNMALEFFVTATILLNVLCELPGIREYH